MANLENPNSQVPVSPPLRTWDFMESLLVGLIAYAVFTLAWWLGATIELAIQGSVWNWSPYGAGYIVASLLTVGVLWVATRMAHRDFAEYLALNWPSPGEFLRAFGITAILLASEILAANFFGREGISPEAYAGARQIDGFLIFMIGGCIAAPIMEEFVYRGFLFRGWSQSFLGPVGSIGMTSLFFAMTHTQYDLFGRFCVFAMGLALGYFRWRSNSTWLTVMVHSASNIFVFFTAGMQL